jgi:hypothetical protein
MPSKLRNSFGITIWYFEETVMAVIVEKASRFQSMSNRFTFSSAYPLTVGKTIL